tara:strand:+ start:1535 stop:2857 length:1323 start_codon:yes stop_codon:yes gene_type:complete
MSNMFFVLMWLIVSKGRGFKQDVGAWLPVASKSALSHNTPNKVMIFNKDWVVWKSDDGLSNNWVVQLDQCIHRKAPLSQGRLVDRCIECPYHGWQYDKNGKVNKIPQHVDDSSVNIISNTVPTYVLNDLVWGFFPEKLCGETSNILDTPEKTYGDLINQTNPFFVRELPYSFDILIENFMDPAHIPFAHHGLQGVRTDGSPIPMEKLTFNNTTLEVSFNDTILNKSRQGVLSFNRPCGYHFKTKSLVTNKWKKNLQIYAVPVKNGRSRVLIQSPFKSKILPLWLLHALNNRFLNTDAWLHIAEKNIDSKDVLSDYTLIESDKAVYYWRKWWQKYGFADAPQDSFSKAIFRNNDRLSWYQMTNIWEDHTKHCESCKKSLVFFKRILFISKYVLKIGVFLRSITIIVISFVVNIVSSKIINIIKGEPHESASAGRSTSAIKS